jgi:putative flippase GtrA
MKGPDHIREKIFNYETVSYLIAGVLTTAVDYIVFIIVNEALRAHGISEMKAVTAATAVSWAAAVLFAYAANKFAVFKNFDIKPAHMVREFSAFVSARVLSGAITLILMWLMTGFAGWNEYLAKVITSVFNVVFNYVASKLFIFKK